MKRVIVLGLVSLVALLGFQKMSNSIEEFWTGTPHCDRSPHDRIADGVILEKIR